MVKCVVCGEEAPLKITTENENGVRTTKHYCNEHGKEVFRPLFWGMYGINYEKEPLKDELH